MHCMLYVTRHCSSQKKSLIKKRDMHIYTGRTRSKYSPAGASTNTHAYIDPTIHYVICYTTSSFEKAGLLVRFNNDPAGVLSAVDNDEAGAGLQLVIRPGGWPLLLVYLHDHELLRPVVRRQVVVLFLVPLSQGHHCHQRIAMLYLGR